MGGGDIESRVHDLPSLLNKRLFVFPCVARTPSLEVFSLLLFRLYYYAGAAKKL